MRGATVVQRLRRWFAGQWSGRGWQQADQSEHDPAGLAVDGVVGSQPADEENAADAGMSTVEYAVGTVVAAAFAAVLYKIVTGDSVVAGLTSLVNSALHTSL